MLKIENLKAGYDSLEALKGISLNVADGEIICLLGVNGAGKTTTLRTISGIVKPTSGRISMFGTNIVGLSPQKIVRLGISHVPEGRQVFPAMSVMEHFELGAFTYYSKKSRKSEFKKNLDYVFELFPTLSDMRKRFAGNLSGGEQQMVAIGRALMSSPKLILLDEPTMGIAPILVKEILKAVQGFPQIGISALLVEQNAHAALKIADRGLVLVDGKITLQEKSEDLIKNDNVRMAYMGAGTIESRQVTSE
jgi:branched-chain amino acid transport system ATP-binding protein